MVNHLRSGAGILAKCIGAVNSFLRAPTAQSGCPPRPGPFTESCGGSMIYFCSVKPKLQSYPAYRDGGKCRILCGLKQRSAALQDRAVLPVRGLDANAAGQP